MRHMAFAVCLQACMIVCLLPVSLASTELGRAAAPAACRVRTLVFDCVRQLLLWPGLSEAGNRPVLRALLAAFHKSGPQAVEEGGAWLGALLRCKLVCISCWLCFGTLL